jgi:hypothetical protein
MEQIRLIQLDKCKVMQMPPLKSLKIKLTLLLPGCVFLVLSTGCHKEEKTTPFIDESLQVYFNRFVEEGSLRGVEVDFGQIEVEGFLDNTLQTTVSGQCQHDINQPDRVIINQSFWNRADAMKREFLVFHELGHCYLNRSHLDGKNSSGFCLSIMHSGANICQNAYSEDTRSYYLDELFNEK